MNQSPSLNESITNSLNIFILSLNHIHSKVRLYSSSSGKVKQAITPTKKNAVEAPTAMGTLMCPRYQTICRYQSNPPIAKVVIM